MRKDSPPYRLVKLANGAYSVHSLAHHETFHPVIGPVAEAEALYVHQLNLPERLRHHSGEFVIWDVGLGAAANALTVLRTCTSMARPGRIGSLFSCDAMTEHRAVTPQSAEPFSLSPAEGERAGVRGDAIMPNGYNIRLLSFDHTIEPLEFALQHTDQLEYLRGYETQLRTLLTGQSISFEQNGIPIKWELHLADFPSLLARPQARAFAKPHVIMFDAFSPAKNPSMWTQPLFARLFQLVDPDRSCVLPTYSRSTILRVTLLLAGFFVGIGHATGEKEETTIASNSMELITEPLDRRWLQRAHRSTSAEPLHDPIYRQARLSPETYEKLLQHPQFI